MLAPVLLSDEVTGCNPIHYRHVYIRYNNIRLSDAQAAFTFGPSPCESIFKLWLTNRPDSDVPVKIYDLNGKVVREKRVKVSETSFDLSGHPSGVYILEVDIPGQGKQKAKVVVDTGY